MILLHSVMITLFMYSHVEDSLLLTKFIVFFFLTAPSSKVWHTLYMLCLCHFFFFQTKVRLEYVKCNPNSPRAYVFVTSTQRFNFVTVL